MKIRHWCAGAGACCVATISVLGALHAQQGSGRQPSAPPVESQSAVQRDDTLQPPTLPPLPAGMTIEMIADGDRIFHSTGGCFVCHGVEAQGMPAAGDRITVGLSYIPATWGAIDSLVIAGMPDAMTRSPIAMPGRGARGDLSWEDASRVAAYVWAISQTRGEPWPGGHPSHGRMTISQAAAGTSNDIERRLRRR